MNGSLLGQLRQEGEVSAQQMEAEKKEEQKRVQVEEKKDSDITKTELLTTLKQKNKEMKKQEKRLQKLEEAYKGAIKVKKQLQGDREALIGFIEGLMRGGAQKVELQGLEVGTMKTQELLKIYDYPKQQMGQESKILKLQNQLETMRGRAEKAEKEVTKLEQENSQLKAEHILKFFKSASQSEEDQALSLQKKLSSQSNEILMLKERIREQQDKIAELSKREKKEERIIREEIKVEPVRSARKMTEESDQDIKTYRSTMEEKNKSLQKSLGSTVDELNTLKVKMAQLSYVQDQRTNPEDESIFFDLDDNLPKIKKLESKIKDLESLVKMQMETEKMMRSRITELEKSTSYEMINIQYLKNVILKYMEYVAQKNHKEAQTLEYVIFTVLQCEREDLKKLGELRESSGFLGYFKGKKGMKPPDEKRAEKYSDNLTDRLSQSVMHTSRSQRMSSFSLNQSYDMAHTERARKESDNIFKD